LPNFIKRKHSRKRGKKKNEGDKEVPILKLLFVAQNLKVLASYDHL
jgi:hypothetical protein